MTDNSAKDSRNNDYLSSRSRIRVSDLKEAKTRGEKWAMLTCYDATSARIFEFAGLPCVLVGDSAAQMVYGYKTTLPVTMDELIPLARAVASSCQRALVIADLPFGSYQESPQQALRNAARFMKEAQVHAIKLEGGAEYAEHVALLVQSGIPVMAHIGFTPQSEHTLGGYKVQGRGVASHRIFNDAETLQRAGAFACVLELVPQIVAKEVTSRLQVPTIGIGAGPHCDAQILVWHDMAGFSAPKNLPESSGFSSYLAGDSKGKLQQQQSSELELSRVPKFVKRYANLSDVLYKAVLEYVEDVKCGTYPAEEHCYE